MRPVTIWIFSIALSIPGFAQNLSGVPSNENAAAFINRGEEFIHTTVNNSTALVEGIFQECKMASEVRCFLSRDRYLLMRFDGVNGARTASLLTDRGLLGPRDPARPADSQRLLDALIHTMTPDWNPLANGRYEYTFVKAAFTGALHTLVYDVKPNGSEAGFVGRIYVDTRNWTIVRYTGVSTQADEMLSSLRGKKSKFRIDGWRANVNKDIWLPAWVYLEEVAPLGTAAESIVKGQVRFWGYRQTANAAIDTRGEIFLNDRAATPQERAGGWAGPQASEGMFKKQAEDNVLARFTTGRFTGPPGAVEKMLDQVLANLILSNNIAGEPMHVRVLLTAPLESFLVNNTIFLGREFVNTAPTEAAVAMVLAHQLAHSLLAHRKIDRSLAFPEILRISDAELLAKLSFRHGEAEERSADELAMKLISNSPYKGELNSAALYMQVVQMYSKSLTGLISPTFGEDFADLSHTVRDHPGTRDAVLIDSTRMDPQAAKPLGSRLEMDPWTGALSFFRQETPINPAPYERQWLGIAPFLPYLDYFTLKPGPAARVVPTRTPLPRSAPPATHRTIAERKGG
jgi:hypothetical protein